MGEQEMRMVFNIEARHGFLLTAEYSTLYFPVKSKCLHLNAVFFNLILFFNFYHWTFIFPGQLKALIYSSQVVTINLNLIVL